ncbi:MAG TPA: hypothetical protein PKD00_00375, partial [Burkholderiales bacterium]|nr:hypothetical protein [Burkholderiales bacterium]
MQENEKLLAQEAVNNFAAMKNRRLDRQRDKRDCAALSKLPAWNQSAEMKRIVCASCPELCTEAV